MKELIVSSTKPQPNRKFTDEQLRVVHSRGLSTAKMADQLGVSRQSVCKRLKKIGLKPNGKSGSLPKYMKVGSKQFNCWSCERDKPLSERYGTICYQCRHLRRVCTKEGALRYRYNKKKSYAKQSGIPFTLTYEYFKGLFEQQDGKDGYTGEQLCFDFGHGRSGATASLDRIDNDGGYTPDNVVFCSLAINGKKSDKPVDQFIAQLKLDFSIEVSDGSEPESKEVS